MMLLTKNKLSFSQMTNTLYLITQNINPMSDMILPIRREKLKQIFHRTIIHKIMMPRISTSNAHKAISILVNIWKCGQLQLI
jgi:hypothetical protein